MRGFEVIVLGCGGMGSAALYSLARRGVRVLGLEQFDVAHDRGSSHGRSRLIRRAYFEHPNYVPLVDRAFEGWAALEEESGRRLFEPTGLVLSGKPDGPLLSGVKKAADAHDLVIETMDRAEAARRFAGFHFPLDHDVLFEPDAGFLRVEACVRTCIERALAHGAVLKTGVCVLDWSADADSVTVNTTEGSFQADRLVITGGPWSGGLLAGLNLPLEVRRKVTYWHRTRDDTYALARKGPVFGFEVLDGFYYGFPCDEADRVKIGEHFGGEVVADPAGVERGLRPGEGKRERAFVSLCLTAATEEVVEHSVCFYTMTPDEHFIVDCHPDYAHVVLAAGFSGHGFKFASVMGEVLADLSMYGSTEAPIEFLALYRPALRGS